MAHAPRSIRAYVRAYQFAAWVSTAQTTGFPLVRAVVGMGVSLVHRKEADRNPTHMKIAIITNELFENRKKGTVGSSRIRGTWLLRNWPEAELWHIARRYDAIIFQKSYFTRYMEVYDGIKILDLCDPDWLEKKPVVETIELCDAVTCSSQALTDYVKKLTDKPVVHIPDRVDIALHQQRKLHRGAAKSVVWYGYSSNFRMVDDLLATVQRLDLQLTVISDNPYYPRTAIAGITEEWIQQSVRNLQYNQELINEDLVQNADIVLNPRSEQGKFRFKSSNKTVIAWALGIPVAHDSDELERLIPEQARAEEAKRRLEEVHKNWDIKLSVEQYKRIIEDITRKRAGT